MSVSAPLVGLVAATLTLAACGGGSTPTQQPGVTPALPAGADQTPTEQPGGGTGGPGPTSGGGTGSGGVTISDTMWSSGTAHVVVSGGQTGTYDLTLTPGASMSASGQTNLTYRQDASPQYAVTIAMSADSLAVSIISELYVGGGGSTTDSPCSATFAHADSTSIEGQLVCPNAAVLSAAGVGSTMNIQIDFTAGH